MELNTFIKLCNLATTGGQAKTLIRSGVIMVNDTIETRNKYQIKEHDKIYLVQNGVKTFLNDRLKK